MDKKTPLELCLDRWGVSSQEYYDTPHSELFSAVSELVCKSNNYPEKPDCSIVIFQRGFPYRRGGEPSKAIEKFIELAGRFSGDCIGAKIPQWRPCL